ncbi:MAG: HAD family hydrolase [Planctomycetia bacterium]|nr:HAD family hydrolase [Planctomycetia bacterium]
MRETPSAPPLPPPRLLVLDVDGTVSDSRHEITEATSLAVARVMQAGIRVMLATGRRYRDVLPVAARLGVTAPLVTASGALVKQPEDHATLFASRFESGTLEAVMETIVGGGHEPVLYTDSFAKGFDFLCRSLDAAAPEADGRPGIGQYLRRNAGLARVVPSLDRTPPPDAFAGFAMGNEREMLDLEAALHAACPGRLSLHTIRSPRYHDWMCEFAPAGVTKWSGVLQMAAAWGIAAEEICAVGDDVNDLPMIRGAGLGVAMGNARPEVLAAADRIVAGHDDGGIEQVADLLLALSPQPARFGEAPPRNR